MKHFTRLVLALALFVAFAGLSGCSLRPDSGLWRGSLVVRDDPARPPYNCRMEIDLTHTEESVTVHQLRTACENYATNWPGATFEVRGSTVLYEGRPVGWVGEDNVTLELDPAYLREAYPALADKVSLSWTRVGEYLEFSEVVRYGTQERRSSGWLMRVR